MYQLFDKDGTPIMQGDKQVCASAKAGCFKAVNLEKRTLHMVGTDEGVDRDGDILMIKGWMLENYLKNPVFLWMHDRFGVPLGMAQKVMRKRNPSRLEFLLKFAQEGVFPFSDLILNLYSEKIINASSVSFMPFEWEEIKRDELEELIGEANISPMMWMPKRFSKQELLELSGVTIPANPRALQVDDNTAKGIRSLIQSKGVEADDGMIDVLLSRTRLEIDDSVRERTMNEMEDMKNKGVEFEEETEFSSQVPKNYEVVEPDVAYSKSGFLETDGLKPYKGEFGCKLKEVDEFEDIIRKNNMFQHESKRVDIIYGMTGEEKAVPISYRLRTDVWTEQEAKAFCEAKGGVFEEAEAYKKYAEEELRQIVDNGTALISEIREIDSELADELERLVNKGLVGVKLPPPEFQGEKLASELSEVKAELSNLTETVKRMAVKRGEAQVVVPSANSNTHELMLFGKGSFLKTGKRKGRRKGVVRELGKVVSTLSDRIGQMQ